VRKVDVSTGVITTIAGSTVCSTSINFCRGATTGDGGLATAAQLNHPSALAIDAAGDIYVAATGDDNPNATPGLNRVRRIDAATGIITTVAGGGTPDDRVGDGGPATSAWLHFPRGMALDAQGNLYIADLFAARVRRVDAATGTITTVAGTGMPGLSGDNG